MCSLPVYLRRVGKKNGEVLVRNRVRGFLDIVHSVKMRVVDPRQMNLLAAAFDGGAFVEQHSYPHAFKARDHPDRVVVAQDAINRPFQGRPQPRHSGKARFESAESLPPVVAGEDAKVIFEGWQKTEKPAHRGIIHIDMQITEMQDTEAIEAGRNTG